MPPVPHPVTLPRPAPHPAPGTRMRRLLAVLALLFGGLGAEAVQPGPCQLICNSQVRRRDQPGE